MMKSKNIRKNVEFILVTAAVILTAVFLCTMTVRSRAGLSGAEMEGYYRQLEDKMVKDTRQYLNSKGFYNSGVMLTRVIDTDGIRQYKMTVHHGFIDELSESERNSLQEALAAFDFEDDNSVFYHEFLLDN